MSIQARMSANDPRLYSVNRDVAHNFDFVVKEVAKRCEEKPWQDLALLAEKEGITDEDLGRACQALCRFVVTQADQPKEGMATGLTRCGWFSCKPIARAIVMAHMGTVILGMNWAGVREATLQGKGPALGYRQLRWYGMRCAKLMSMKPWRRWFYLACRRIRMAWRALWEKDNYG